MKRLEVILKLTERCNINCTYCYIFNGQSRYFEQRPSRISQTTIVDIAQFLQRAAIAENLENVQIDFHGGEPLVVGKGAFDEICSTLVSAVGLHTKLNFAVQTNATLVDPDWVDLFEKYQVAPGVSLDGLPEMHNKHRVDHKGVGTYESVANGLRVLKAAYDSGRIPSISVLSVIDPTFSGRACFNHITKHFGVKTLDFLLPDNGHDVPLKHPQELYTDFLKDVFDAWIESDDPKIYVRFLASITSQLLGGRPLIIGLGGLNPTAITISTDGSIGPDDTLRSCGDKFFSTHFNAATCNLGEVIESPQFKLIDHAYSSIPEECDGCNWRNLCRGGYLVHRFSDASVFSRKSVFCGTLMNTFDHIAKYILKDEEIPITFGEERS